MKNSCTIQSILVGVGTLGNIVAPMAQPQPSQPERTRTDMPAAIPADQAPGSALNPQLDSNRQVLAVLEGRWNVRSEAGVNGPAREGDGGRTGAAAHSGEPSTGQTAERTWVLGGKFLQEVQSAGAADRDAADSDQSPGMAYWGYDEQTGMYSFVLLDGRAGRAVLQHGWWNPQGQAFVFRGEPARERSSSAAAATSVTLLRIVSDSEHVVEVYAQNQRAEPPTPSRAEPKPKTAGEPKDNGPEIESAPPGVTKLPAMNPPEEPEGRSTDRENPDRAVPIDEDHLVYRITYTRAGAARPTSAVPPTSR